MEKYALDTPIFFGRPLEEEVALAGVYFDYAGLVKNEHALTREFYAPSYVGKRIRDDITLPTYWMRGTSETLFPHVWVSPRPEVTRGTNGRSSGAPGKTE